MEGGGLLIIIWINDYFIDDFVIIRYIIDLKMQVCCLIQVTAVLILTPPDGSKFV